jgi:hypothetical protein
VSGVAKVQQPAGAPLDLTVLPDPRPFVEQTVVVTRAHGRHRDGVAPIPGRARYRRSGEEAVLQQGLDRRHLAHRAAVRCIHEVSHGAQD